jgi:phage/plasmid-like protein (TIGR03299 family)
MTDELETGFFAGGEVAWHGKGEVFADEHLTSDKALVAAGLDWNVVLCELYGLRPDAKPDDLMIHGLGHVMSIRDTDNKVLGVGMSPSWTPIQNNELYALGDEVVKGVVDERTKEQVKGRFYTGGSLFEGRRVWGLLKLDGLIVPGGEESERMEKYLLLANGHDGGFALHVLQTNVRVVCNNTLTWAIAGAHRAFKIKHTSTIEGRLEDIRQACKMAGVYHKAMEQAATAMMKHKVTKAQGKRWIESLVPLPPDVEKQERAAANAQEARAALEHVWLATDNLDNVRFTSWGFVQAVADYEAHGKAYGNSDSRMTRLLWQPKLQHHALQLAEPELVGSMASMETRSREA